MLRKLRDMLCFAYETMRIAPLPAFFVGLYSYLIVYLMILAAFWNLGVFVWVVPVVMLSLVVVVLFRVLQKHHEELLDVLMGSTHFKWDIDQAVEAWLRISRKKEERGKD